MIAADSFSATGKWVSKPSNPKNEPFPQEVEIDCFKGKHGDVCVEATAEYYMGHPHISVSYLDILKWDKDGIVAIDSSGVCMTNTVLINFADQSISDTVSLKKLTDETKSACAFFGAGQSESLVFVLKGSDQWNEEHWKGLLPDK